MDGIKPYADLSLAEIYKRNKSQKVLLLDISSSMDINIEPGKSRWDALKEIVGNLKARMFAFDTHFVEVRDSANIPPPRGGTHLSPVLKHIRSLGIQEVIVLTDGDVNDEDQDETLKAAYSITLKIMYIGSGTKPEFLDKLARNSGGECTVEDLRMTKELEEKVQLLLGPGPDKKGTINL